MGEDFYRKQRDLIAAVAREQDVIITTAAVPGKKAPVLITADMVRSMAAGSVVVDLAAERGGNCELTRAGETVIEHGVTVLGPLNLASAAPYHASQMYARNIATFLKHLIQNGKLTVNFDDEITRETLVTLWRRDRACARARSHGAGPGGRCRAGREGQLAGAIARTERLRFHARRFSGL